MTRRRFNGRERAALYLASGGVCSRCARPLSRGWHADHVQAFARGGDTDVLNGQALCPDCNLKKGVGMQLSPWPIGAAGALRDWQELAVAKVLRHEALDFLCVATPGAGKTRFALKVAHTKLWAGEVDRVVIVCPTEHLKKQWATAAGRLGINLDPKWSNRGDVEAADYHGVAVTYAQVAMAPTVHRAQCRRRTMVVFDEIHHVGDGLTWGNAMIEAFGPAAFRLLLSGTPFRSDGNPIPFVSYAMDKDGVLRSVADHTYSYAQALTHEDVCRPVLFPSFDGRMEWEWKGAVQAKSLSEDATDEEDTHRIRTALTPDGEWLRGVMRQANDQLTQVRQNGHPDAAGLVITMDQTHAKRIAQVLTRVAGEAPIVAVSDDPQASDAIESFASGRQRWIVAVKMVSEGVDIPRLRVGVYATNVMTEMYFRQAVGRFVRWQRGIEEQTAYFYIPSVATLIRFAETIKEERDHQLREEEERVMQEWLEGLPDELRPEPRQEPITVLDAGRPDLWRLVMQDGDSLKGEEFEYARQLGIKHGFNDTAWAARLALLLRDHDAMRGAAGSPVVTVPSQRESEAPVYEQKRRLRKVIAQKVARLAMASGDEFRVIHNRLIGLDRTQVKDATIPQLQAKVQTLTQWLEREGSNA